MTPFTWLLGPMFGPHKSGLGEKGQVPERRQCPFFPLCPAQLNQSLSPRPEVSAGAPLLSQGDWAAMVRGDGTDSAN